MTDRARRIAASLFLALALPAAAIAATPRFQAALDALGVPLTLPPSGKAIVVNIPAFELIAFEDAEPVLRSRVIVGTPWHRTPVMTTRTTSVRFRPTWRPTPSMIASGEYRDRVWPPGPENPLGLAAVRLEEGLLVYLHDTNRRDLFDREYRALSHGCVRVQAWDELVAFVLDADLAAVHALANGRSTTDVPSEPPIPVILGYYRVFPDDAGRPVAYDDVYGRGSDGPETDLSAETPSLEACGQ
jgi:murein L,D-transpeptidase YcbB/YkuD